MNIPDITHREFEIMAHSLGIHPETNKRSKKKSDKRLTDEFYRNRFVAGDKHKDIPELLSLEQKSFMERGQNNISQNHFFCVTELGEFKFRKECERQA